MNPVVLDVETSIFQRGNAYSDRNKLCYVGMWDGKSYASFQVDGFGNPYGEAIKSASSHLRDNGYNLVIGFNVKFDIAWCHRYGIILDDFNIWDLQLAEFIISAQASPLPSLDDTCSRVGIHGKSGDISSRYWALGIDTPNIPVGEMEAYLRNDCEIEYELFNWQVAYLRDKPKLKRLIWNACQDLRLTREMECNGIRFNLGASRALGDTKLLRIEEIDTQLDSLVGQEKGFINWNSPDWLSAILYGGTILVDGTESYEFQYKDGRTATKTRKQKQPLKFPRLVEPLRNSKAAKDGFFFTNEGVLRKLKATGVAKAIIKLVLERNTIDTQVNRYLHGIPRLYEEMDWTNSFIHGQLQHCTARTGRLASSKPNVQNLPPEANQFIQTRFQ